MTTPATPDALTQALCEVQRLRQISDSQTELINELRHELRRKEGRIDAQMQLLQKLRRALRRADLFAEPMAEMQRLFPGRSVCLTLTRWASESVASWQNQATVRPGFGGEDCTCGYGKTPDAAITDLLVNVQQAESKAAAKEVQP